MLCIHKRVDNKRATMVVRYDISGGLGRAGLRGWPSVEASLVGDVGRHGKGTGNFIFV